MDMSNKDEVKRNDLEKEQLLSEIINHMRAERSQLNISKHPMNDTNRYLHGTFFELVSDILSELDAFNIEDYRLLEKITDPLITIFNAGYHVKSVNDRKEKTRYAIQYVLEVQRKREIQEETGPIPLISRSSIKRALDIELAAASECESMDEYEPHRYRSLLYLRSIADYDMFEVSRHPEGSAEEVIQEIQYLRIINKFLDTVGLGAESIKLLSSLERPVYKIYEASKTISTGDMRKDIEVALEQILNKLHE